MRPYRNPSCIQESKSNPVKAIASFPHGNRPAPHAIIATVKEQFPDEQSKGPLYPCGSAFPYLSFVRPVCRVPRFNIGSGVPCYTLPYYFSSCPGSWLACAISGFSIPIYEPFPGPPVTSSGPTTLFPTSCTDDTQAYHGRSCIYIYTSHILQDSLFITFAHLFLHLVTIHHLITRSSPFPNSHNIQHIPNTYLVKMLVYPPRQRSLSPPTAAYSRPRSNASSALRRAAASNLAAAREAALIPMMEVSIIVTEYDDTYKCWYPVEAHGPVGERLRAFVESRKRERGAALARK